MTPDKNGKTQLYYLDESGTPAWKKTNVFALLPKAPQYIRSVGVTLDGILIMGYGADTHAVFCKYNDTAPYYTVSSGGCVKLPVEGAGGVMRITSDAQNRVYTLAGDDTITRYAKDPGTGNYAKDGSTFNDYKNAFQITADNGPGSTSMVIIGDVNTHLL